LSVSVCMPLALTYCLLQLRNEAITAKLNQLRGVLWQPGLVQTWLSCMLEHSPAVPGRMGSVSNTPHFQRCHCQFQWQCAPQPQGSGNKALPPAQRLKRKNSLPQRPRPASPLRCSQQQPKAAPSSAVAAECCWARGQAPVHPHEPGPRSRSVMLEVPVGQQPGGLAPGLAARPQQQRDRVLMA
jgi:hypothetical protein